MDGRINKCNMFLIEIMVKYGTFRGGIIRQQEILINYGMGSLSLVTHQS